jgi:hypothetical protein
MGGQLAQVLWSQLPPTVLEGAVSIYQTSKRTCFREPESADYNPPFPSPGGPGSATRKNTDPDFSLYEGASL